MKKLLKGTFLATCTFILLLGFFLVTNSSSEINPITVVVVGSGPTYDLAYINTKTLAQSIALEFIEKKVFFEVIYNGPNKVWLCHLTMEINPLLIPQQPILIPILPQLDFKQNSFYPISHRLSNNQAMVY